jgi:hypothetical protein
VALRATLMIPTRPVRAGRLRPAMRAFAAPFGGPASRPKRRRREDEEKTKRRAAAPPRLKEEMRLNVDANLIKAH